MKKRIVLFLLIILSSLAINAQVVQKTLNVTEAGTITKLLSDDDKKNVTNLTLSGVIDARDFKCMRDEIVKLAVLDLKAVSIQEYTGIDGTVPEETTYKAKQLPDYAFCTKQLIGKKSLQKITFPDNLTETGAYSFYNCIGLIGPLELPFMLELIGEYSFYNCTGISGELIVPKKVNTILKSAFAGCSRLTGKLKIPLGITVINEWTFYQCTGLTSVEIPKKTTTIDALAFAQCSGLTYINCWADAPPKLGMTAFAGVNKKTCALHVPMGRLSVYRKELQWKDFVNVVDDLGSKIINMTEAGTLTKLLSDVEKQNITNLTLTGLIDARDFKCMRDEIVKLAVLDLKEVSIQEYAGTDGTVPQETNYKANKIPESAFCNASKIGKASLQSITFPKNLSEVGSYSFFQCTGLTGMLELPPTLKVIGEYSFINLKRISGELKIPESMTSIGIAAFTGCEGFTGKLTLPSGITVVNEWSFYYCSGLSIVEISKEVSSIQRSAFSDCLGLKEFYSYPEVPPTLGDNVFKGIKVNTCLLHVPKGTSGAYMNATQWKNFVNIIDDLPRKEVDVKTVNMTEAGTLSGLLSDVDKQNITNLTLTGPIDARDFKCMRDEIVNLSVLNLKAASIQEYTGTGGTAVGENNYKAFQIPLDAFYLNGDQGKTSLTTITFPDNLIEIGEMAFYKCTGLTGELLLPSALEVIDNSAFAFCTSLTGGLKIPASVTAINDQVFYGCTGFTGELELPQGLTYLGVGTFQECNGFTGKLVIPSEIIIIDQWAFLGCSGLTSVEIPKGIDNIKLQAFSGCTSLKDFSSWSVAPPGLGDNVFENDSRSVCVLHVPKGSLDNYRSASQWKDFFHIQDDLIPTDIDQNSVKDVQIGSVNNQIFVTGEQKIVRIEVFDQQGRVVIDIKANENSCRFQFDKSGSYIVRVQLDDGSVRVNRIILD